MNLGCNIFWTLTDPTFYLRYSSSHIFFSKKKNETFINIVMEEIWMPMLRNNLGTAWQIHSTIETTN